MSMLKLKICCDTYLDLYILYGEETMFQAVDFLKEEIVNQIDMLKKSGEFDKYKEKLHNKLSNQE